jgi:hypothetical protein
LLYRVNFRVYRCGQPKEGTTSSLELLIHQETAKMPLGRNDRSPRQSFGSDALPNTMRAAARLDAGETWWAKLRPPSPVR